MRARWRPWAAAGLVGSLFILLYLPQFVYLVSVVWREARYSHGYLIPAVSLFWLWTRRQALGAVPRAPASGGYVILGVGIVLWLWAQARAVNAIAHASILVSLSGIVAASHGYRRLRAVAFPLLYLVFCFPVPKRLDDLYVVLPLQSVASRAAESIVSTLGIPVLRQGNVLEVPGSVLLVEEACSGIHSLFALLALGVAAVFFLPFRRWVAAALVAATVPIAIAANVLRIVLTAVLAVGVSPKLAEGFSHQFAGVLVFITGLALFAGLATLLARWWPVRGGEP